MSVTFPGTAAVRFEWVEGSPETTAIQLTGLENYLANTQVIAEKAKDLLIVDMMEKFETETDPSGRAWEELVQPEVEQIGILRRGSTNAQMYHDAISDDAWEATPVGVFFNTAALPPYWEFHEQIDGGQHRIPQRAFIDATSSAQDAIENMAMGWLEVGIALATVFSPRTGKAIGRMGQTSMVGGIARREIHDPATGRFVSTRPEFYT